MIVFLGTIKTGQHMDHFMKERRIKMSIVVMPFQVYSNDDCIPINLLCLSAFWGYDVLQSAKSHFYTQAFVWCWSYSYATNYSFQRIESYMVTIPVRYRLPPPGQGKCIFNCIGYNHLPTRKHLFKLIWVTLFPATLLTHLSFPSATSTRNSFKRCVLLPDMHNISKLFKCHEELKYK